MKAQATKRAATAAALAENATKTATATGANVLGEIVWYEFESDTKLTPAALAAAFKAGGLDSGLMPTLPSPREVFARCARRITNGLTSVSAVPLGKEAGYELFGLFPVEVTDETNPMARKAKLGEPMARVAYFADDPDNPGKPSVEFDVDHPAAVTLRQNWLDALDHYGAPDLSEMCRATLIKWGRLRMREMGAVYFVPRGKADVSALAKTVSATGAGTLFALPQIDAPATVRALQQESRKGLESEIRDLREKIATFGDRTRSSSIEASLHEAARLKEVCALYRDLTATVVDDLVADIGTLDLQLNALLGA